MPTPEELAAAAAAGDGAAAAPQTVPTFKYEDKEYAVPDVIKELRGYQARAEDIKNLDRFKEDAEIGTTLTQVLNSSPKLRESFQAEYARLTGQAPPAAKPADNPPAGVPAAPAMPPEFVQRLEAAESSANAVQIALGNRELAEEKKALEAELPFLKGKSDEILQKDAKDLVKAYTSDRIGKGVNPMVAHRWAVDFVSNMSLKQIAMETRRDDYEKWLLSKKPGNNLPPSLHTRAEGAGDGRPGPTKGVQEQFKKEYAAAMATGDSDKAAAVIQKYSGLLGSPGTELLGVEPGLARDLSRT